MTTQNQAGRTPKKVATHATRINMINPNKTALIGLFGAQEDLNALIRSPNGKIQRVKTGKRLGIGKVVGIDKYGVMIEKNDRSWRMSLPTD